MIQGIIQRLIADATVQSTVGTDNDDCVKVYPVIAPEKVERPYVTAMIRDMKPDGCPTGSTLDKEFFDVVIVSKEYKEGYDIEDAVRRSLEGFRGTSSGINFQSVAIITHRDAFDDNDDSFIKIVSFSAQVKR